MNPGLYLRQSVYVVFVLATIVCPSRQSLAESAIGQCEEGYAQCLKNWQLQRLAFLKGEDGYLNLAGLFWLKEGSNTFGGDRSNDLVFPGVRESNLGMFTLRDGQVTMSVNSNYDVRAADRPVTSIVMSDDTTDAPTVASYSGFNWTVIRRAGQFAIRLRDFNHPAIEDFPPIESYPADKSYRVKAKLKLYAEKRVVRVDTVIAGLDYNPWSPGVVQFELGGLAYELEAYDAGSELFIVFGDRTSGRETYPAGRFLYALKPENGGNLILDFNTAHNPPCAFNEFATCPIASARNRLPVSIPAGERFDPTFH